MRVRIASCLLVAACCLLIQAFPSAWAATPDAETAYRQYLAAFKLLRGPHDPALGDFLAEKAREKLADLRARNMNCAPCPDTETLFRLLKEMRPYPSPDVRPVVTQSNGVVKLEFQWREPAGSSTGFALSGTDITVTVELVQEQGWKLKSESWVEIENPGTATVRGSMGWSY